MKKHPSISQPLPITFEECKERGWSSVDIILVTGDAYIDHPSFGIALIGRLLESHGYRVAVLSQPRFDSPEDFKRFGRPNLFFGISAGNLDSIVANYSGSGKVRDHDAYSTDGNPYRGKTRSKANRRRPDRATLLYGNLARSAYKDIPVILGGVEASLRRFTHYDYKQNTLRGSILSDSKASLLVFGMGEHAVLEVAKRLEEGRPLHNIAGTCERLTSQELAKRFPTRHSSTGKEITHLPSWEEIQKDNSLFLEAEKAIDRQARSSGPKELLQKQQSTWILQHPSSAPLSTSELDALYALPFTRKTHPNLGDVPAYRMICHSLTIVRGCSGNCSFCAITRHQGTIISSRSKESLLKEATVVTEMDDFRGTISDLGGPTANLYGTSCRKSSCSRHDCLFPKLCPHLQIDEEALLQLLAEINGLPGINHVFISSGLRMELLLKTPRLLEKILLHHTPGSLKIAPEHTENEILKLMHKENHETLQEFVRKCRDIMSQSGKKLHLTPYIISAHPGCREQHNRAMVKKLKALNLSVRQFQDFTPTPGTLSTAMFVAAKEPAKGKTIHVPKNHAEKMKQRKVLQDGFMKKKSSPGKSRRRR